MNYRKHYCTIYQTRYIKTYICVYVLMYLHIYAFTCVQRPQKALWLPLACVLTAAKSAANRMCAPSALTQSPSTITTIHTKKSFGARPSSRPYHSPYFSVRSCWHVWAYHVSVSSYLCPLLCQRVVVKRQQAFRWPHCRWAAGAHEHGAASRKVCLQSRGTHERTRG